MTRTTGPTIGVFDSGFGGLTVLRALLPLIPAAHYIYLGDTARLPYGAKSQTTIARYAVESARFLEARGASHLVIACNTATALALPEIRSACTIPATGVITPGAKAAYDALTSTITRVPHVPLLGHGPTSTASSAPPQHAVPEGAGGFSPLNTDLPQGASAPGLPPAKPQILVLATAATVQSHAYHQACAALNLDAFEQPCPLLVPLIEEGWTDHPVTREVLRIYLTEALAITTPAAVLLGCTHYPLIANLIRETLRNLGHNIPVIDSAAATAATVAQALHHTPTNSTTPATFECHATDSIEKFARIGTDFLGHPIPDVHLLNLGG